MASDIITLMLAVLGMVFLLYSVLFRLLSWKEQKVVMTVPLFSEQDEIVERINNLRTFAELCGVHKKCFIVVVNYGASKKFCAELMKLYEGYDFLHIVDSENAESELCALLR